MTHPPTDAGRAPASTLRAASRGYGAALLVVAIGCGLGAPCAAQDGFTVSEEPLHFLSDAIWPSATIFVCWAASASPFREEREWVREAVERTWEAYSMVDFRGWGRCISKQGIEIGVEDTRPHTKGLGSRLDGKREDPTVEGAESGMILNFTFRNWEPDCARRSRREGCIKSTAVHEFGHALGFAHEQNRPDTPDACRGRAEGTPGDVSIGAWDLMSVLNYCNPRWNNGGALSPGDIEGLRMPYGEPPEPYDLMPDHQDHPHRGWSGYRTLLMDVDGDGDDDLVWNRTATLNRTYVGLSDGDGTFELTRAFQDHRSRGWSGYRVLAGDVDGDGDEDLVWNQTGAINRVYVGLANDDDAMARRTSAFFDLGRAHQDHPNQGWSGYETLMGDVNDDDRQDLIWNQKGTRNRIYVALGNDDGTFTMSRRFQDHPETGWSGYVTLVGDLDADGDDDLVWARTGDHNRFYIGRARGDGTFDLSGGPIDHANARGGWNGYRTLVGDLDAKDGDDLVWNLASRHNRMYTLLDPDQRTIFRTFEREQDLMSGSVGRARVQGSTIFSLFANDPPAHPWSGYRVFLGDVDGDRRADLVWNHTGTVNRTYVGMSRPTAAGLFRFARFQDHDERGWSGYETLTGDVDGNGTMDLVWNRKSEVNRVYVGLAIQRVRPLFRGRP